VQVTGARHRQERHTSAVRRVPRHVSSRAVGAHAQGSAGAGTLQCCSLMQQLHRAGEVLGSATGMSGSSNTAVAAPRHSDACADSFTRHGTEAHSTAHRSDSASTNSCFARATLSASATAGASPDGGAGSPAPRAAPAQPKGRGDSRKQSHQIHALINA
jgi:hypothetical protein